MGFDVSGARTIDMDKVRGGVWCEVGQDAALLVSRPHPSNPRWRAVSRRLRREAEAEHAAFTREHGRDETPDELEERTGRYQAKLLAQAVILDWRGFELGGEPLPYTPEEGERVLLEFGDELLPLLYGFIGHRENFQAKRLEESAGN